MWVGLGFFFLSPKIPGVERQEGQSGSDILRASQCNPIQPEETSHII